MDNEIIGLSFQGRPLSVQYFGGPHAPIRVLFLCGQHGDERAIRSGMRHFVQQHGPQLVQAMPLLQLAVLGDANPDGYAARTRSNAQGIDLNRDHVQLRAPETRAVHEWIRRWQPHLIVDFHNYPARRKQLVDQRLRLGWDVCLDIPTNPAAACRPDDAPLARLFQALGAVAQRHGHHFGRYGLYGRDGSFRHGTPQLGDARNTLTLRYEVPTLLIEVRNPSRSDVPADRHVLRAAVAASAWELCAWAMREAGYLSNFGWPLKAGSRVPLGFRRRSGVGTVVPVRHTDSGAALNLGPTRDRSVIDPRRHRTLPAAYQVDGDALALLLRQGFQVRPPQDGSGRWEVSIEQRGGRLLALLLEQQSRYHAAPEKYHLETYCHG